MFSVLAIAAGIVGCATPLVQIAAPSDCPVPANSSLLVQVTEPAGMPVAGATIRFTAPSWDSTIVQTTDGSGSTMVVCVPAGRGYVVTVAAAGHHSVARCATTLDGRVTRLTLSLQPDSSNAGD
jgi:hypothetical protein